MESDFERKFNSKINAILIYFNNLLYFKKYTKNKYRYAFIYKNFTLYHGLKHVKAYILYINAYNKVNY